LENKTTNTEQQEHFPAFAAAADKQNFLPEIFSAARAENIQRAE
jgi:hypothetical protein